MSNLGGDSQQTEYLKPEINPLACKLLKASAYAYNVNSTGAIQPDTGLATLLGETGDAFGVSSSGNGQTDSDRDAVLMWRSDNEVIIAFRGTLPYKTDGQQGPANQQLIIEDWLNNADFTQQPDPELGLVHQGFMDSFDNLWPGIVQQIKAWQAAGKLGPQVKVYVTGHSKGGALAMLTALKLWAENMLPVTEVDTFAAPRVGGEDFAAKYAAQNIADYRYENQDDLVPLIPLDKQELQILPLIEQALGLKDSQPGNYVSVGQLRYINADLTIIAPADAAAEAQLEQPRLTEFGVLLLGNYQDVVNTIINAHSIGDMSTSDTSRYYQAVCGVRSGM
ncbi:MAG: lipase family protein [Gammaproteobacteria bacterium]